MGTVRRAFHKGMACPFRTVPLKTDVPLQPAQQLLELFHRHRFAEPTRIYRVSYFIHFNQCPELPAIVLGKPQEALKHTDFLLVGYVLATPAWQVKNSEKKM